MSALGVLVVGCGTMGSSHARAYRAIDGFRIVGLVSRGPASRERLARELGGVPTFDSVEQALRRTRPDAACISTHPDSHAEIAQLCLRSGAHVFVEKPIARTEQQARRLARVARATGRKLVVGYILRHHPAWIRFIEEAGSLGRPLVMRMNLNQQSSGASWEGAKRLMQSVSPLVDCGVHYVDVMCQMTGSRPVRVHAVGARLSGDVPPAMNNYGQLQVSFDDGSVGWYESAWGPMVSETAFFVKDVFGPAGSVSMVSPQSGSADIATHTRACELRVHRAQLDDRGAFVLPDRIISFEEEPDHQQLCEREQRFFLRAIREDVDLCGHLRSAVDSLRIVLAADRSIRTGRVVPLAFS